MFSNKIKLTPGASKVAKVTKQQMGKPAIRYGQGDKQASLIFYYQKNSPQDMTATPSENC